MANYVFKAGTQTIYN